MIVIYICIFFLNIEKSKFSFRNKNYEKYNVYWKDVQSSVLNPFLPRDHAVFNDDHYTFTSEGSFLIYKYKIISTFSF